MLFAKLHASNKKNATDSEDSFTIITDLS
jgi:hypothetical protein